MLRHNLILTVVTCLTFFVEYIVRNLIIYMMNNYASNYKFEYETINIISMICANSIIYSIIINMAIDDYLIIHDNFKILTKEFDELKNKHNDLHQIVNNLTNDVDNLNDVVFINKTKIKNKHNNDNTFN